MNTGTVVAIRSDCAELEQAVTVTQTLLATVAAQLFDKELLEINDILHQLELCAEHPAIEEYGIVHGGFSSIIYRLCDVMKDVAAAGDCAKVAAGNEAHAYAAHSCGPN
jgi:hypothetical protein